MKRIVVSCLLFLGVPLTIFGVTGHGLGVQASEGESSATALVRELGSIDPRTRDRAHARLESMGEPARDALVMGMTSSDSEVKWRCERLLAKLGDAPTDASPAEGPVETRLGDARRSDAGSEADRRFEDLGTFADRKSLIERFTAPEARSRARAGGRPGLPPHAGQRAPFGSLLEDFDAEYREMMERMEALRREALEGFGSSGRSSTIAQSSRWSMSVRDGGESISFEADDDGARATVTREEPDGSSTVDSFEAESIEQFRENFPDLAKRLGLDDVRSGGSWRSLRIAPGVDAFGRSGAVGRGPGLGNAQPFAKVEPNAMPRKRLGILCGEVPLALSRHLDLPHGVGIVVEEVEEGSAAERLGLEPYDILMGFQGVPVRKPDDIRSTLRTSSDGDTVTLDIVRRGQARSLSGSVDFENR